MISLISVGIKPNVLGKFATTELFHVSGMMNLKLFRG